MRSAPEGARRRTRARRARPGNPPPGPENLMREPPRQVRIDPLRQRDRRHGTPARMIDHRRGGSSARRPPDLRLPRVTSIASHSFAPTPFGRMSGRCKRSRPASGRKCHGSSAARMSRSREFSGPGTPAIRRARPPRRRPDPDNRGLFRLCIDPLCSGIDRDHGKMDRKQTRLI